MINLNDRDASSQLFHSEKEANCKQCFKNHQRQVIYRRRDMMSAVV